MYKLIAKILNGDELVKYEVLDMKTNRTKILSIEQVQGLAMAGSLQDVVFHERTQNLKGVNGNDLRRLARKQESIGKASTVRKNCFEGSSLIRLVEQNTSDYRERYLVADLMTFLNNKTNGKICTLYGLRRTGKTIMMFHAIKRLLTDRHEDVAYITLTEQDSLSALYQLIDDLVEKEIHYLFLDEITESYVEELTEFLVEIGVIKMYVRYVGKKKREVPIFIQPGLRYHQTIALVNALRETESFYDIPFKVREELCRKIIEGVEGNLLEHEVLLSCLMKCQNKREEVTQITYLGKEIDMIVHDDYTIDMYEVKRSSGKSEEQYKWLVDKEFNDYIEAMWGGRIRNRIVLYLGEDDSVKVNGMEIRYQNMNQFLKV